MGYSPLARMIGRRVGDARRAENLFILAAVGLFLGLMLANQIVWAFIREEALARPEGPLALGFWAAQLGALFLYAFGCVIGFKPEMVLTWTPEGLRIDSQGSGRFVAADLIRSVQPISPQVYHRHFRRYAATEIVVNRLPEELLLVDTVEGPIVIGLEADDRLLLQKLMTRAAQPVASSARRSVLVAA